MKHIFVNAIHKESDQICLQVKRSLKKAKELNTKYTANMSIRIATIQDIPQLQRIRNAVQENRLSDPALVKDNDYVAYLTTRGRGWVSTDGNVLTGFAIADLQHNNIWALFVDPAYEGRGIGRQLHDVMLDWYFQQCGETIWLSTECNSRAERFYRKAGWIEAGPYGTKEIKFEMPLQNWLQKHLP